jgi:hypothetical protein
MPGISIPKPRATTVAGAAACGTLLYNLLSVAIALPALRIATMEGLTLGAAVIGSIFLARPTLRRIALQAAMALGTVFALAGIWQAGRSATPIPTLGLDLAAGAGLLALALPLLRAAPARA